MTYQLIIFDFDGTLVNSQIAVSQSAIKAYQQLGYSVPDLKEVEGLLGQGLRMEDILRKLSAEKGQKAIQEILARCRHIYLTEEMLGSQLFPGVEVLLAQLKKLSIGIVIVSNKLQESLDVALRHFQLTHYIKVAVGIRPGAPCKPDPVVYHHSIQSVFPQIPRERILMVGDTRVDLQFAQALKIDACWARYGYGNLESCMALGPTYSIEQLTDLQSILSKRSV